MGASDLAPVLLKKLTFWERLLVEFAKIIAAPKQFVVVADLFDGLGTAQAQEARRLLHLSVDETGCGVLLMASDLVSAWVADYVWCLDQGELALVPGFLPDSRSVVALETSEESSEGLPGLGGRQAPPEATVLPSASARIELTLGRKDVHDIGHAGHVPDDVRQLLATEAALDKLGARGISTADAGQTLWNRHVVIKNLRGSAEQPQRDTRRLLIGRTNTSLTLTLVIEETIEPTTWLLVTGWNSTRAERMILDRS